MAKISESDRQTEEWKEQARQIAASGAARGNYNTGGAAIIYSNPRINTYLLYHYPHWNTALNTFNVSRIGVSVVNTVKALGNNNAVNVATKFLSGLEAKGKYVNLMTRSIEDIPEGWYVNISTGGNIVNPITNAVTMEEHLRLGNLRMKEINLSLPPSEQLMSIDSIPSFIEKNAQIKRLEKEQDVYNNKTRLAEIEARRLKRVEDEEENHLSQQLEVIFKEKEMFNILNLERIERERQMQNQIITFNEQQNSGDFNETPITEINLMDSCSGCGVDIHALNREQQEKEKIMKIGGIAAVGVGILLLYTRRNKK